MNKQRGTAGAIPAVPSIHVSKHREHRDTMDTVQYRTLLAVPAVTHVYYTRAILLQPAG